MKNILLVLILLLIYACNREDKNQYMMNHPSEKNIYKVKNHSYSNVEDVFTKHLDLNLTVDFENKKIKGVAHHHLINKGVEKVIFDVSFIFFSRNFFHNFTCHNIEQVVIIIF